MAGLWCVHHNQRFLVFSLLFITFLKHSIAIEEFLLTCGGSIDLITNTRIHSGVLKVDMPTDFSTYQGKFTEEYNCDININFESGINLQIELYYLDIMPISSDLSKCSTGLVVLERNQREVFGGRLCREGWRWEKEHREKKQEKKIIKDTPLTFRLISDGPYKGTGFKVHFNKFRTSLPCNGHREFRCERLQRCVHDDITCDGWDDCGDDSDESEDAGCELFTVCEIFAIIIGVFLILGTVVVIVVFLIKYRRIIKRNRLQRKESKLALEEERRSMQEPSIVFPHRFNSMESVNKSHYSRSHRMDVESLMDRMELEKADKYSCKDNMSERSYKSVNRRNRMASQASLAKEKAGIVGRSNQDLEKDMSDRNNEKRERGRSGREDDRESERQRKDNKYSDGDEEYDSEEERRRRRRRRRSRDRRRYDRSDDEDYDSDYDRRSRKSRDRDRYDSEDENDSDRDRRRRRRQRYDSDEDYDSDGERRRRRRSRRRYDSDDDYDSDSERKRRSRKNLDEEDNDKKDDDKESSRRRRRSRDRRRYDSDDNYDSDQDRRRRRRHDSDEYDSDRDRRRRRSRDRRSRDLSEEKIDKDEVKPVQSSQENNGKSEEPNIKQPMPENQYQQPQQQQQPGRERKNVDPERHSPHPYLHQPSELVKEKQIEKPQKQEANNFSPLPKQEDTSRYTRRTPRSNGVSPAIPTDAPTNGNAWVPRSERKRNRRSRGDLAPNEDGNSQDIYEDVVPKIHLENLGIREEAV